MMPEASASFRFEPPSDTVKPSSHRPDAPIPSGEGGRYWGRVGYPFKLPLAVRQCKKGVPAVANEP
jgi:hypothetical protein